MTSTVLAARPAAVHPEHLEEGARLDQLCKKASILRDVQLVRARETKSATNQTADVVA